jgi:hypothetical protein
MKTIDIFSGTSKYFVKKAWSPLLHAYLQKPFSNDVIVASVLTFQNVHFKSVHTHIVRTIFAKMTLEKKVWHTCIDKQIERQQFNCTFNWGITKNSTDELKLWNNYLKNKVYLTITLFNFLDLTIFIYL